MRRPRPKNQKNKAADETAVYAVIEHLSQQVKHRILRDIFRNIIIDPAEEWTKAERYAIRDLFILAFLYETGARAGEMCELGTVVLNRATAIPADAYTITGFGKTFDSDYYFTHTTAELWRIWQAVRPASDYNHYAVIGWKNGREPHPLQTNGLSQILVRRCWQVGQSNIFRVHALRHAKVQRSRRLVGVEVASALLDHRDIKTTIRYTYIDNVEIQAAAIATGLQKPLL